MRYDVIIVGAGAMGSAAAMHLAARGRRVIAFDRFDVPNDQGSSHGLTRIIRIAYYEHPSYVPLLVRAAELWAELERRSGESLFVRTGSIDASAPGDPVFEGSRRSCEMHGLRHEVLTSAELARRLKIETKNIFAAGDHLNDLPMLSQKCARWLGAPANAVDEVKETVRRQNGFVSELRHGFGVADALRSSLATAAR